MDVYIEIFSGRLYLFFNSVSKLTGTVYILFSQITSDDGKDLRIEPAGTVTIRGNENVFIDSGKLNLKAKNSITLGIGKEVSERFSVYTHTHLLTQRKLHK